MPRRAKILNESFYDRTDVLAVARDLLGKILVTRFDGELTSGRIVETEAYAGEGDRACHAFGGRRTARTEAIYSRPGTVYIYLCYGLHHLFNVVSNKKDIPNAVLVRALEPLNGVPVMLRRTGKPKADHTITKGPGNLSRALGMSKAHSGTTLLSREIYIEDDGFVYPAEQILATKRIGVDFAREDAELPYRFIVKGNPYVSAKKS